MLSCPAVACPAPRSAKLNLALFMRPRRGVPKNPPLAVYPSHLPASPASACGDSFILLKLLTVSCQLLAGLSPLECAVTSKHRVLPGFGRSCPPITPLECALTKRSPRNPFRMRTYKKSGGRGVAWFLTRIP